MKISRLLAIIVIACTNRLCSQQYFKYENPMFSFSIPNGWKQYSGSPTPNIFDKFVKNKNGKIGGILRVGQDIYSAPISSIWNLNQVDERKVLEKEAVLRNYSYKKETLNDSKVVRINFDTTIGEGDKRKEFSAVIYKFLVVQQETEYVVFFFLITDPLDFEKDNQDLLKIISTANFQAMKSEFVAKKEVEFNGHSYIIPMAIGYDYFSHSTFREMKINEFTKTHCFTEEISVVDLELLVPRELDHDPIIHIYSYKALENANVTRDQFNEYKVFWKSMFNDSTYDKLADKVISDSLLFCRYEKSATKPIGYIELSEGNESLSTFVFMNGNHNGKETSTIIVTNYLHINNTVVFMRLSQVYSTFTDIEEIKSQSQKYLLEFLKLNSQ